MQTLNEIYIEMLKELWFRGEEVSPRGIKCKELLGYKFILEDSTDKIITVSGFETNLKYAWTEYNWYCSGSNRIDFNPLIKKIWKKYSDDGKTASSGYGKQIFGKYVKKKSQWQWIIDELKKDDMSRRCVININMDYHKNHNSKDIPCTIAFQVLLRKNKLNWITFIRSNDVVKGIRNDIYCFTSLQQKLALELGVELGVYHHVIGSLHLYQEDYDKVKKLFNIK